MSEFYVRIVNNKIDNQATVRKAFEDMKKKDGTYKVKYSTANKRSLKQNNFYWLILTEYIQPGLYELGYRSIKTKDDAHLFCTNEFLKAHVVNELTGEIKVHVRSTTELTTIEWEAYREDINQFASEYLGIVLPEPGEALMINY